MGTNYGKVVEIDESCGAGVAVVDTGLGGEAPCWPMAPAGGYLAFATGYGVAVY